MTKSSINTIAAAAAALSLTAGSATAQEPAPEVPWPVEPGHAALTLDASTAVPGPVQPAGDIVEVAAAAGRFETLLKALEAAGLAGTLRSEGPFTVFAPTDEAFGRLPEGTLGALLADMEELRSVLTYHVVPGRLTSDRVIEMESVETVNGASLRIGASDGTVHVDDARVVQADVEATNGVIHVIDAVVLPPEE